MRKQFRLAVAALAAFTLVAAGCTGDDDDSAGTEGTTAGTEGTTAGTEGTTAGTEGTTAGTEGTTAGTEPGDTVNVAQGQDLHFHVITHSDEGIFWSVVQNAVEQAGEDLGVDVEFFSSHNDAEAQSQAIEAAIAEGSDGIAISLADPEGVGAAAQAVTDAGIPLYTINSGLNDYKELGAVTHIGQTETVAGEGAGDRMNELGATKVLCARQEQTNIGLEERCDGLESTFEGEVVSEFVGLDQDQAEQQNQIAALLQADPDIDAVLGTGPVVAFSAVSAQETAGREVIIGGFDISPDLIAAIEAGDVAFTVDQQQYLQGYLPVVLMYLQATNLNTAGGGQPILTGPGFVDAENVTEVAELVEKGTR